jgi:hypothetical protein
MQLMGEAPGYSMVFDAAVRAQSIADAVRFLQRNLQPRGVLINVIEIKFEARSSSRTFAFQF